jgi:hypothetical protein
MEIRLVLGISIFMSALLYLGEARSQTISQNTTGTHQGFYYSFWTDHTSGKASMTLKGKGRYKTKWTAIGNFTAGKGWAIGKEDRIICYDGKFYGGKNGFLAVYGWTKDSLVEYYVVENYGEWIPPGSVPLGSFESDGRTYRIYKTLRINQPSIVGTSTFYQYWSVSTSKTTKGTVTFANHVAAWKSKGMHLGKVWDYQILETEGNNSSGYSAIRVKECGLNKQKKSL